MKKLRLLLVDDQSLFREALRTLLSLQPDFEIVAEAENGERAVALAKAHRPDVVLMDLSMPDMTGSQAAREILREQPSLKIVALSAHLDEQNVAEAAQAGVVGMWPKDVEFDDLVAVIRSAYEGERPMHPVALEALARSRRASYIDRLSQREHDVLLLLNEGLTNREIAGRLKLSEATVKGHVSHILAKLGLKNRAQLALYAERSKDK